MVGLGNVPRTFANAGAYVSSFQPLLLDEARCALAQSAEIAQRDLGVQLMPVGPSRAVCHAGLRTHHAVLHFLLGPTLALLHPTLTFSARVDCTTTNGSSSENTVSRFPLLMCMALFRLMSLVEGVGVVVEALEGEPAEEGDMGWPRCPPSLPLAASTMGAPTPSVAPATAC